MRIETIPLIVGILVVLFGLALLFDAWTPDEVLLRRERRRRVRTERSRGGEASMGVGVLAMGAAFIGRDSWRYSIVAVLAGLLALIVGAALNRHYLHDLMTDRGKLRRAEPGELPPVVEKPVVPEAGRRDPGPGPRA